MEILNLENELRGNAYPGRGIVLGRSGKKAVIVYFIMGRSENSRNRIFVEDGDGIRTQARDPSKMKDPSLIIYAPVRVLGGRTIVTNGDQTDTVFDFLSGGKSFAEALRTREFEPDAPSYTPRISGLLEPDGSYSLSILKSLSPDSCARYFWEYERPLPGLGHFIHTYTGDGEPLPSFCGEPKPVALGDEEPAEFAQKIWDSLNPENRVSLFVRFVSLEDGSAESRIINRC